MGKEKRPATSLTASVDDRMEKGMVPEIISWPMAVRHQFVIREASIVNHPNNLTLRGGPRNLDSVISGSFASPTPSDGGDTEE
jgi:hypothetical protein